MALKVQEASKLAADYLSVLTPSAERVQLEEIEFIDQFPNKWLVTLSYLINEVDENPFAISNRKYKIFTIDANSGEVTAMKIREFK